MNEKGENIKETISKVRQKALLRAEMEKQAKKDKGSVVFTDEILYGKIPQALLRDRDVPAAARLLYGVLHTYSQPKKLESNPHTFVSQAHLAWDMGISIKHLIHLLKVLTEAGWITIKRRGLNQSNIYYLHSRKRKKR